LLHPGLRLRERYRTRRALLPVSERCFARGPGHRIGFTQPQMTCRSGNYHQQDQVDQSIALTEHISPIYVFKNVGSDMRRLTEQRISSWPTAANSPVGMYIRTPASRIPWTNRRELRDQLRAFGTCSRPKQQSGYANSLVGARLNHAASRWSPVF